MEMGKKCNFFPYIDFGQKKLLFFLANVLKNIGLTVYRVLTKISYLYIL